MKKLLVLMLVLGLATAANAVTYDLSGDTMTATGTISVDVTGATADVYLALVISSPGGLGTFTKGTYAPSMTGSVMAATVNGDAGEIWAFGTIPEELYQDGSWLTAAWSGASTNATITVYSTPDGLSYTFLDSVLVPEPMTIALLGLGGLFLRRRK